MRSERRTVKIEHQYRRAEGTTKDQLARGDLSIGIILRRTGPSDTDG